jgi:hypothetical protein
MIRPSLLAPLFVAAALAAGCSSTPEPAFPEDGAAAKADQAVPEKAEEKLPKGTVARASVDHVLVRGPAFVLGKVETEEVLRQNKFVGWRLVAFPADWDTTGLQPGDVVTGVNGQTLERPDDLWDLWVKLADATEIKIDFERDGKPASTVVKIQGAPDASTKTALANGTTPTPASDGGGKRQGKTGRRDTVVITGGDDDPSSFPEY